MADLAVDAERERAGAAPTRDRWRPYAPSWANRVIDWLARLPGPTWLPYVVASTAAVTLELLALGLDAGMATSLESSQTTLGIAYYGVLPFAVLGLIARLDGTAERALTTLRPVLRLTPDEASDVLAKLTIVPARPSLVLTAFGFAFTAASLALDPAGSGVAGFSAAAVVFRWAWESFVTTMFLLLIYHTVRQLRIIGRLHESLSEIDVFDQGPLYALSSVTSTTAVGLVLLLVPSVFLIPSSAGASFILITAAWYAFALAVAAGAFHVPLRGIHAPLDAEQDRLKGASGRGIPTVLVPHHRAVDAGDATAVAAGHQALSALTAERDLVAKVPTWPWSTGALTRFLSAVLLPIGLWLITRFLERVV